MPQSKHSKLIGAVRDRWESITRPQSHPASFRAAQMRLLLSQMPMMAGVSTAVALVLSIGMLEVKPLWLCASWFAFMAIQSALQYIRARRLFAKFDPSRITERAISRSGRHALILAIPWSAAAILFFPSGAEAHQILLAFVVGGMMAGVVATLSPIPAVILPFLIALSAPLILRFLIVGDRLHLLMGLLLAIYTIGLYLASRMGFRRFCDLAQAQTDLDTARLDLLDAIESSEEAFALYDADGKAVVRNRRHREFFGDAIAPDPSESNRIHQHKDGRWLQSSIRKTVRGGWVAVHSDISALKERQRELERARDRANAADRAKSEFLALMSHELRTPLNAILGFSQMIEKSLKPEQHRDYAASINKSGNLLLAIINDILDLSKIESGSYALDETDFPLAAILDDVCAAAAPIAAEKSIAVVMDPANAWPVLTADERAVRQMLLNLISNGIKFTPNAGQVTIGAEWTDGEFVIAVKDTGIGIATDDIPKIFEAFRQVESSLARNEAGTGLGVPIVDRLARQHGGHLSYESEIGVGTTARLHFPRSRISLEQEAPGRAAG